MAKRDFWTPKVEDILNVMACLGERPFLRYMCKRCVRYTENTGLLSFRGTKRKQNIPTAFLRLPFSAAGNLVAFRL